MLFDVAVMEKIHSIVGPFEVLSERRKDSSRTGVMEIRTDNNRLFVKVHNRLSRWNPEVYAYKHWTKVIEPFVPTLFSEFNDNGMFGIITTPIPGKTVNEMQISDDDKLARIYYDAGQLFRKMQANEKGLFFGIPNEDGSPYDKGVKTDAVSYVSESIESLFQSTYDKGILDDSFMPLVRWCLKNCDVFKGEFPAPTNWDLSPNNWMVDEDGNFTGFIDFENMLWGISLDSFAVITERYTFDKPFLKDSFFKGYGLENDEVTKCKQNILSVKSSIASIALGHESNNSRLYDCSMRMLRHISNERQL